MRFRCALAFACSLAVASCGHERREVRVTLVDACGLTESADCERGDTHPEACGASYCSHLASWANLAIFKGRCPDGSTLLAGDLGGAVRIVDGPAGSSLPGIGELDDGKYGFAGIFRASDCSIVGIGCTEVDLSEESSVRIDMLPAVGSGFCAAGQVCEQGACIASENAFERSCSPVLVGTGTLPAPQGDARAVGIGLVATDSGYLLAYREDDASSLRIRILPIDKRGNLGEASETSIPHCGNASDAGFAMAISSEGGLIATTLAPCEDRNAGAAFVAFAHDGSIVDSKLIAGAGEGLRFTHRSIAAGPGTNEFELVYMEAGFANRLRLKGARPDSSYEALFPDVGGRFAQVASSKDYVARLVGSQAGVHVGVGPWEATPRISRIDGATLTSLGVHEGRVVVVRGTGEGIAWDGRTSSGASFGDGSTRAGQPIAAVDIAMVNGVAVLGAAHAKGIVLVPVGDTRRGLVEEPKVVVHHGVAQGASSLVMVGHEVGFGVAWMHGDEGAEEIGGFALFDCTR